MAKKTEPPVWDIKREMDSHQYQEILKELGLTRAAAARFLGCSQRTSSRYWHGTLKVPPSKAMLLRAFLDSGMRPVVPPWQRRLRF